MAGGKKVAVLGPNGQCGHCVVDELLARGHVVVGISRNPPKTWSKPGQYSSIAVDFGDIKTLSTVLSEGDFDAVVSAFGPPLSDMKQVYRLGVEGQGNIKMAILRSTYRGPLILIGKASNSASLLDYKVADFPLGGAGSLHYKNGVQLCDDTGFCYNHWQVCGWAL